MPVQVVSMDYSLQLKFNVGEDEDGKDIIRSRTLNRINAGTPDEDLYEMAIALANLQQHDIVDIVRNAPVFYERA